MDLGPLLMLGLNLAGTGAKYYQGRKSEKLKRRMGKAEHGASVRSARRNLFQAQDEARRGRRMLEESLSARGVGDSSIAQNELSYFDRQGGRAIEGAQDAERLADMRLAAFRRQVRNQRLGNYLNLGLGLANAGLGAWSDGSQAPQPVGSQYGGTDMG